MSDRRPENLIARLRARAAPSPLPPGPWPIVLPPADLDPYLAATLWLIDLGFGALIAGPEAQANRSVHARALLETVLALDGTHPGPVAQRPGLGIVLAAPTCAQLERLNRRRFDPSATWFLVLSETDVEEREWQKAWLWAHSRPVPEAAADPSSLADGGAAASVLSSPLLSRAEHWALSLRAGMAPIYPAPRRGARMRLIPGGRA
ncbi:hypothetical protein ACFXQA_14540 [Microbacterium sp. P07]|uniref:hypothetical protein n=1 Tax=Microbacterium sp. P07 TaxID=3366952 RepID=UPI003746B365